MQAGSGMQPVVAITGAGSGIGRVCGVHLAGRGFSVVGGDIRTDTEPLTDTAPVLPLDVDDDDSCEMFVRDVLSEHGRIDVLFNNAGFGIAGPAEETSSAEAHAQLETNFFGLARMCRLVLPTMRSRGEGLLVNMSSIGGLLAIPFQPFYSAAKFAVEGYSEALRLEVQPFGIDVVLIEPSDFRTGFTDRRRIVAAAVDGSAYRGRFEQVLGIAETDEREGSDPAKVAVLLERIIRSRRRRLRYTVGDPLVRITPVLKRVLPWQLTEPLMRSYWSRR
jgi:NAD(P)-dependent dehydrogenase (short-subunit alcohol dehydrogenase family)